MATALDEVLLEHALRNAPRSMSSALCPVFAKKYYDVDLVAGILRRHERTAPPSSLLVRSARELGAHKEFLRAVGLAHYARAMRAAADFPSLWCGRSSRNMLLSLLTHGYPSACAARNETHDHTYITMPFVAPDHTGVLLLDPTAAQTNGGWPLVTIEEREGAVWEYRTPGWADGADLYPQRILDLAKCRQLLTMYRISDERVMQLGNGEQRSAQEFHEAAFANPIPVSIPSGISEILKNFLTQLRSGWS